MSALTDKIKTRGYWVARIHPEDYRSDLAAGLAELESTVRESAVSLRGWDFPHYDYKSVPVRLGAAVEQDLDWEHFVETWRATKSGQFISVSAFPEDWRDQSSLWPPPQGWQPCAIMSVESTVFRFTEIFEFAARWTRGLGIESPVVVESSIHGLKDRALQLGPTRIGLSRPRVCHVDTWARTDRISAVELIAQPAELAVPPAIELFELFGFDVGAETIREMQGELKR